MSLDIEDDQAVGLELLRRGIRKSALAGRTLAENGENGTASREELKS